MTRLNLFLLVSLFSIALVSELLLNLALPAKLQARPTSIAQMTSLSQPTQVSVTFEPQGESKPDNSAGGASRSPNGKNGIWYDTVATLADLRKNQPENTAYTTNWQQVLKSVGLEAIATEPLLQ